MNIKYDVRISVLLPFFIALSSNLAGAVEVVDILPRPWSSSAAAGFAQRACDKDRSKVEAYLKSKHKPYLSTLVRQSNGEYCHLIYEPSVQGFGAKADYGPAHSLVLTVSRFPLALGRPRIWGDTFDIHRLIHQHTPNLPKIVLTQVQGKPRSELWNIGFEMETMDWTQDFISSGRTSNQATSILVPYRIFQGDSSKGERFEPFLREWSAKSPVANGRSKLSWEGGDFVVLKIPDKDKTLLIYGDTIFGYWAADLSSDEVEFILKIEFGVDYVLNGRGLSSHVDYTLLPLDEKRILFRSPFNQNFKFLCDLTNVMLNDFEQNLKVVPAHLRELRNYSCSSNPTMETLKKMVDEAKSEYQQNQQHWIANRNFDGMDGEFESIATKHCASKGSSDLSACLQKIFTSVELLGEVKETSPKIVEAYLNALVDGASNRKRFHVYFDLLDGQINPIYFSKLKRLSDMRQGLSRLGYELIAVPSPHHESSWAGLSYVNSLVVDKKLFLPSFGLSSFELELKNKLKKKIPDFDIHLIPATVQISNNGGIHCSVKAIR